MFKGLFLLVDYEPLKVWIYFWSFLCLDIVTGRFGDRGMGSYEAFCDPAWGTVPVTLRSRVQLHWP